MEQVLCILNDMTELGSSASPEKDEGEIQKTLLPLKEEEKQQLAGLLERIKNTEIKGEIWHQLVKKFITVPIELCILDKQNRVFLYIETTKS